MAALGDLIVRVGCEIDGFRDALRTASQLAGETIDNIAERLGNLQSVGANLALAGGAITAGLTVPILKIGEAALGAAGNMEQVTIAMTHFMGSAEKATEFVKQLAAFASTTPFQVQDLMHGAQALLAMHVAGKDVIPTLRTIGDQLSSVGRMDQLDRVILAFGKLGQASTGYGRELMELNRDAVVPTLDYIAQAFGKTTDQVKKMMKDGLISGQQAADAVLAGIARNAGGMMASQMDSYKGLMTNVKDQITLTLVDIGNQLLPFGKMFTQLAGSVLAGVKSMASAFGNLPAPVRVFSIALLGIAAGAGPALVALGGITFAIGALAPLAGAVAGVLGISVGALAGWGAALGVGIAALAAFALAVAKHWSSVKAVTVQAWAGIKEAVGAIFAPTVAKLTAIWNVIGPIWTTAWNGIASALKGVWMEIWDAAKVVWGGITFAFEKFISVARTIPGVAKLLDLGKTWDSAEKLRISTEAATGALKKHGDQAPITAASLGLVTDAMNKAHEAGSKMVFVPATMDLGALKDRNQKEQEYLGMLKAQAQLQAFNAGVKSGVFGDQALDGAMKIQEAGARASASIKNLGDALKLIGDASTAPFDKIKEAYKTLDIESSASLMDEAKRAQAAFALIKNSGMASAEDIEKAFEAMNKAMSKANKKGGPGDFITEMSHNFGESIQKMLDGTTRFSTGFKAMGVGLLASWGQTVDKMIASWLAGEVKKLVLHLATNAGIVTDDAATAAASDSISLASHAKDMLINAEGAAAKAFKAAMELPFPINAVVAPIAAAGAFAGVMALGAVSAEGGADLPNYNTVGMLHPREMVLPRGLADKIRGLPEGANATGGHTFHQVNNYKSPTPASMSRSDMAKFSKRSGKAMMGMARNRALGIA